MSRPPRARGRQVQMDPVWFDMDRSAGARQHPTRTGFGFRQVVAALAHEGERPDRLRDLPDLLNEQFYRARTSVGQATTGLNGEASTYSHFGLIGISERIHRLIFIRQYRATSVVRCSVSGTSHSIVT